MSNFHDDDFGMDDDVILLQAEEGTSHQQHEFDMADDLDGIDFDEAMDEPDTANLSIGADCADKSSSITADAPSSKPNQGRTDTHPVSLGSGVDGDPGFDAHAGQMWIYPTNYPVRDYQYNIVQQVFKSCL